MQLTSQAAEKAALLRELAERSDSQVEREIYLMFCDALVGRPAEPASFAPGPAAADRPAEV